MATLVQDPGWEGDDRPRVLIEATEWHHRNVLAQLFARHGYATATCAGPEGTDDHCPLAAGGDCRAAREADVVVHTLRPTDERNRQVLRAVRRRHPTLRVIAEVAEPAVKARPEDYYRKCVVVSDPAMWESIVNELPEPVDDDVIQEWA